MFDVLDHISDDDLQAECAIVLTYELQLPLFDGWIRRRLAAAGARIQLVFADLSCYERELSALTATRHFGRSYAVAPVSQTGAFHPKVYLLVGRKRARLVVGSGNATVGGLVRNAEVFGQFDFDVEEDAGPHPAFGEVIGYIRELAAHAAPVIGQQLERALQVAPWLAHEPSPDDRTLLVGGPGRPPLFDQIRTIVGEEEVLSSYYLSSSFDRRLEALRRIADWMPGKSLDCIVQSESINLDGESVRDLGDRVTWRAFLDPYPEEKRKRRDARAHAKLWVITCGDRELVVFGSANASRPALLSGDNAEIVVAVWRPAGSTASALGLDRSLEGPSIVDDLTQLHWQSEPIASESPQAVVLRGVVEKEEGFDVAVSNGSLSPGWRLAFHEGVSRPALAFGELLEEEGRLSASEIANAHDVAVARVVDGEGEPISNFVGITWKEFGQQRASSRVGARIQAAIGAMQDGEVLGTVLFEVLSRFRDFDVIRSRPGVGGGDTKDESGENSADSKVERSAASYYATASAAGETSTMTGDRVDLDILASLVQPISPESRARDDDPDDSDDPEEAGDRLLTEEAERRRIDAKGGRASGDERKGASSLAAKSTLEKAAKRLARRLDAAASGLERLLEDRGQIEAMPPNTLARQIWMAHIGAFLAGRTTQAVEGQDVLCLDPSVFARYILRLARGLAGGKSGGLMRKVPEDAWLTPDGQTLERGLAFLWTCVVWASTHLETQNAKHAVTLEDAVPALVAARFVAKVRDRVAAADREALMRRLPVAESLGEVRLDDAFERLDRLADRVRQEDARSEHAVMSGTPSVGALAFHRDLGLSVVSRIAPRRIGLVNLSRTKRASIPKFADYVEVLEDDHWDAGAVGERLSAILPGLLAARVA